MNERYADIVDKRKKKYELSGDKIALAVIRNAGIDYVDDRKNEASTEEGSE